MPDIEAVHDDRGIRGYPILPETMLYHWSPAKNRTSITENGLRIRQPSSHAPIRYPMVCLSLDPELAWNMSGGTFVTEVTEWDLWGVHAGSLGGFEVLPFDDRTIREVRVYHRIAAMHIIYIATRTIGAKQD